MKGKRGKYRRGRPDEGIGSILKTGHSILRTVNCN